MRIEYVFDTVCPWCYVGMRRLSRALAQRPQGGPRVLWRPFLLNPDLPPDGTDRATYLERKFGGAARVQRVHAAVEAAGQSEGIAFNFAAIGRMPNSLNSHRLVRYATASGCEAATVEALYHAYFVQGRDIGDLEVLADIGAAQGMERDGLAQWLASGAEAAAVLNDNARAHRLGVNGVPCLILDGSYALAGAQEPDILLRLLDIAREARAEGRQPLTAP